MDVLEYWGLYRQPFGENADPDFFYMSKDHEEALERMKYVIENDDMNMYLLTGEIGSGKTTTKNAFIEEMKKEQNHFVVNFNTSAFKFVEFMQEILEQLDIPFNETKKSNYYLTKLLSEFLKTNAVPFDKNLLIFFDEAQLIKEKDLDLLKQLTNIQFNYKNPVKIFLFGQPELVKKIIALPQINQRIGMRYHLSFLSIDDTFQYIRHRLHIAGLADLIFTNKAMAKIFHKTDGIPREINRACKIALDYGFAEEVVIIDSSILDYVFNDIYRFEKKKNVSG